MINLRDRYSRMFELNVSIGFITLSVLFFHINAAIYSALKTSM